MSIGAVGEKPSVKTSSAIYIDGTEYYFKAYAIGGYNYFRLRDVARAFDFNVSWDGVANTIAIDTSKGYFREKYEPPISDKYEYDILFIGTSGTADVPNILIELAEPYGITVKSNFLFYPSLNECIEEMKNFSYDYVIFEGSRFMDDDKAILCDTARETGAELVFYSTACLCELNGKPNIVKAHANTYYYKGLAEKHDTISINADYAWVYAYDKFPDIDMYKPNDFHMNELGEYYTACVFASTLFGLHIKDTDLGQTAWEFVTYYNETKELPAGVVKVPDGANIEIKL
jgi:hypothetical protein